MTSHSLSKFLPAKEAAAVVSYTPDYVSKLAREHLIVAEQRGRQWFVDLDSLKLFSLKKEAAARERKVQLRTERLDELARVRVGNLDQQSELSAKHGSLIALGTTVALTMCVMLFGGVAYVADNEDITAEALVAGAGSTLEKVLSVFQWKNPEAETSVDMSTSEGEAMNSGIIFSKEPLSPELVDRISGSFSDPVDVSFVDERTGIVTPSFQENDTPESYQFILLPDFAVTTP